jgi:hypothetical protein
MELPAEVLIHNELLGIKGGKGTLIRIHASGFFELNCRFGERLHRVYLPVGQTVLIAQTPEPIVALGIDVER